MLAQRIKQALSVLGGDETVKGTTREQAEAYLGESVDDKCMHYILTTARIVYDETRKQAETANLPDDIAHRASLANVLLGGMAIGKRLGIEDGEEMARKIGPIL